MSLSHKDYANLANDAYYPRKMDDIVCYDAIEYRVLEYYEEHSTHYQGTIYQHIDTGDIIVAHRGTEKNKIDLAVDYEMVSKFTNPQIPHALKLVQRALSKAQAYARRQNKTIPNVTITGHSLGGALAEVSAYEFRVKAETFNGYGSANITYFNLDNCAKKVPLSETTDVINHTMAGDIVSAANDHFGSVRIYIRSEELTDLKNCNYDQQSPSYYDMWRAAISQMIAYNAHGITNFTEAENESILLDQTASILAKEKANIINAYRKDIYHNRVSIIEKIHRFEQSFYKVKQKIDKAKKVIVSSQSKS